MYLVTESQDTDTGTQGVNCNTKSQPKNWYHYLHALDLTSPTLAEKNGGPVPIQPSAGNNGFKSHGVSYSGPACYFSGLHRFLLPRRFTWPSP